MPWSESDDEDWIPGNYSVWFDGDPKNRDKHVLKELKEYAELAIDLYNKTHVEKYSFIEIVYAVGRAFSGCESNMMLTAKHVPEEEEEEDGVDQKLVTFRAHISLAYRCVDYLALVTPADLLAFESWKFVWITEEVSMKKPDKILIKKLREGFVLYGRDSTSCDCKTMNILKLCLDLAIEVYNKTTPIRYKWLELVLATGHSSAGSMVYLEFKAKLFYDNCTEEYEEGSEEVYREERRTGVKKPRTMRTHVSITPYYVEFVELVPHAELL